jgi:GPH family glycoside/pentoside/hexuronide:cation symporter
MADGAAAAMPAAQAEAGPGAWRGRWRDGVAYGAPGLPLAFVALPLYVVLPNHYATEFGVPLAALGAVLLGARVLDALADPWIGRRADRAFARSAGPAWRLAAAAALLLALGFQALFFPPAPLRAAGSGALLAWCAAALAVTYLSYSVVSVIHQAWGARLGGDARQRTRVVAWREGFALAGVLAASVLPALAGLAAVSIVFAVALGIGMLLLARAPHPGAAAGPPLPLSLPWGGTAFRQLMLVYLVNGIASAIPATLVLFFIRDRLQAAAHEPLFLGAYFAAGALSLPLWVRFAPRLGLARSWLAGMALAVAVFAWAAVLGPGGVAGYAWVCALSGIALGADLSLPAALLAGVIRRAGHAGRAEGAYFGWWNFATKLNLALAAGIALPLLQALGFAPGSRDPQALQALTLAYCAVPCALKLLAGGLLYRCWIRPGREDA